MLRKGFVLKGPRVLPEREHPISDSGLRRVPGVPISIHYGTPEKQGYASSLHTLEVQPRYLQLSDIYRAFYYINSDELLQTVVGVPF